MHFDMSLMLREFTRIPTVDRPADANPALDVARCGLLDLLSVPFAHRAGGHPVVAQAR